MSDIIKLSDIMRLIAKTIDGDDELRGLCREAEQGVRIMLGHPGDDLMQPSDKRVLITIAPSESGYDLGYIAERVAAVRIQVRGYNSAVPSDGVLETYDITLLVMDICQRIAQAIRDIDGLGDDVLQAVMTIDTAQWPVVNGILEVGINWPVALASEATL
jgi:hypothetical protein